MSRGTGYIRSPALCDCSPSDIGWQMLVYFGGIAFSDRPDIENAGVDECDRHVGCIARRRREFVHGPAQVVCPEVQGWVASRNRNVAGSHERLLPRVAPAGRIIPIERFKREWRG